MTRIRGVKIVKSLTNPLASSLAKSKLSKCENFLYTLGFSDGHLKEWSLTPQKMVLKCDFGDVGHMSSTLIVDPLGQFLITFDIDGLMK